MSAELVGKDFTNSILYTSIVNFVGDCSNLLAKMTPQGRKLFGGHIRWELSSMTQSLFRACSVKNANQRMQLLENTQMHFHSLCLLLSISYDLGHLPQQEYEALQVQIRYVGRRLAQ
jgi:hypothetical protein